MIAARAPVTIIFAFILTGTAARAEDFRVQASVNATKIGMDDVLELTLSLHGDTMGRAGAPKLPKLDGFRLSGQSQSTSIQFINGQMSSTRSVVYTLIPESEGKHVIGAIAVPYGGKEYLTDPIEVEIVSGSVAPRSSGGLDPFDMFPFRQRQRPRPQQPIEVFVTAELSRPSVYVGEQVLLTYKLYTQASIGGLEVEHAPALTGLWVEEVKLPRERPWEVKTVDGEEFHVFEVKKSYLFPTKAGRITIEPATFAMAVRESADPLSPFFFRQSETIRRTTKPVVLEVKPVPVAGRPAGFSGAVGQFRVEAKLDKPRASVGSPVTLSVVLRGDGNVKTAEPPLLPPLVDFKSYPPKVEESVRAEPTGFSAQKKWEHVLVPASAGKRELGPVRFAYFDPAKERFVEIQTEPLTIDVDGAVAGPGLAGLSAPGPRSEVKLLRRDVRYLKPSPAKLGSVRTPYYKSLFFYATLGLPLLWNLGIVAYRLKRERESSDVSSFRARRARRLAQKKLGVAAKKAREGARDFYEVTSAALHNYLGDKLNVSASGLTAAQVDEMLTARGVPEETKAHLLKTLEACEYARFTPGDRSKGEMEEALRSAEGVIVALERHLE